MTTGLAGCSGGGGGEELEPEVVKANAEEFPYDGTCLAPSDFVTVS